MHRHPTRIVLAALACASACAAQNARADYTLCSIGKTADRDAWDSLCAHAGAGSGGSATTATLDFARNGRDVIVASLPSKNCRRAEGRVYGSISVVVDSSKSLMTTDPNNERLSAAGELLTLVGEDSVGHPLATSDVNYPKVGVVSYGGRQGTELGTDADGINQTLEEVFCLDGDAEAARFDSDGARARWTGKNAAGTLYSVCEYLRPVTADARNGTDPAGSVDRLARFLKYTGAAPRGATDITYFSEAIQQDKMLGGSAALARNAIVITDGLPNIPKYVPEATCKETSYLKAEPIVAVNGKRVCIYRQAQYATDKANAYLDSPSVAARFAGINVYNVLFAPQDKVYYDDDKSGKIFPPDVLIENSSRTGNGKVKFKWAKNKDDLTAFIKETIERRFDKASLQRVIVTVNTNIPYNAVAPADTADSDKVFSIKFIGLRDGANTVKVEHVYSDTTFTRTYAVNVSNSGAVSSKFACAAADATKTVDGDNPAEKNPKGDGVLPPKTASVTKQDRVFRNADEANGFDRDALPGANGAKISARATPAPADPKKDPRNLRLQGGTGNCGSVAGVAAAGLISNLAAALALIGLPLGFSLLRLFLTHNARR